MKQLKDYEYYKTDLGVLYHGDCLAIMPLIEEKVDLVVTDPPYNQGFLKKSSFIKQNDYRCEEILKMSNFNPIDFLKGVNLKLKKFNAFFWTSKNLLPVYINFALENKFNWNLLIWAKNNPLPLHNNTYLADVEYCICIREQGAFFNNKLTYDDYRKVMIDNVAKNTNGHPTQKYLWMIKKMLKIGSKKNNLTLDCFIGSGTTAMACEKLNRRWIGIEKSEEYCEMAKQRIENEAEQGKLNL